uniref:Uncharacterized protein n=1 Tax=Glossina palpalis gambiensis TaxID=67801 RepID=A0A1B0BLL1_9MUSC
MALAAPECTKHPLRPSLPRQQAITFGCSVERSLLRWTPRRSAAKASHSLEKPVAIEDKPTPSSLHGGLLHRLSHNAQRSRDRLALWACVRWRDAVSHPSTNAAADELFVVGVWPRDLHWGAETPARELSPVFISRTGEEDSMNFTSFGLPLAARPLQTSIGRLPSNLLCGYLIGIGIAFLMPVLLSPSFLEHYRSDSDNVTVKFSYNFFLQLNRSFRNLVTTTMENVFRSQIGMPARNVFYNHITRSQS